MLLLVLFRLGNREIVGTPICDLQAAVSPFCELQGVIAASDAVASITASMITAEIACRIFHVATPPPPPAQYAAKAVHFDGSTHLANSALISPDSEFVAFSFWAKYGDIFSAYPVFFVADTANLYNNAAYLTGAGKFIAGVADGYFSGPPPFNSDVITVDSPTLNSFHHFLAAFKTSAPTKLAALYIDDAPVGTQFLDGTFFSIPVNGLSFWIGGDSYGAMFTGDMADFWFASGVNLLEVDGTISEGNRRKFITADKKPVDPSEFPAGGSVLLSGDASSFSTNQLSGGAFILTGTLTDAETNP